jgi:thiamine-phosphate pyrophosphorylase
MPCISPAARLSRGVYLITPDDNDTVALLARVEPLLASGLVRCLQYRNTSADGALRHAQATVLKARCALHQVPLLLNNDAAMAYAIGAAGVHLSEDDGAIAAARALLGNDAIIGASCYANAVLAQKAVDQGASYVSFGAFYPSSTKPLAGPAGVELLHQSATLGVPRVAIGGLTPDNSGPVLAAGADLLAVISGVFDATAPLAALRAYHACFEETAA